MSAKYPTENHPRPYVFDPEDPAVEPDWFLACGEYYHHHCIQNYFVALERFVANLSDRKLAEELEETTAGPEPLSCYLPVDLLVDGDILTHMLEGEIAYRKGVDEAKKRLKK